MRNAILSPLRSFGLAAVMLAVLASAPARAQTIVVMVNGDPITNFDVEQRIKLNGLSAQKSVSRKEILDELIDEKVKIKEAKKYGVDPSASDIDTAFASMGQRMRMSGDQLEKMLEGRGIRPATLKQRIRADMVWGSLVRGRFKDALLVGEKDVQAELGKGDDKQAGDSFEYHMRPVVLIVPRDASAGSREARKKEAEALRARVQTCAEADSLFKGLPNTAIRETVVKTSADLPQPLRELLDKTPVGRLTPPEMTRQGIEMVALCDRRVSNADTPKKREVRDKMFAQKFEAKSKAYLREARKAAMIEYR